jgi:predicted nucleic acid-binding protein
LIVYYLDASAWVKRYYQELGSAWVQNMFAHHRLIASASLGVIEVTATLARKAKGREIDPSMLDNKLRELDEDWTRFIQVHMTMDVVDMARQVAQELALRGADAIHLASALLLRQHLENESTQLTFVASDRELKDAAEASHLTLIDPEDQEVHPSSLTENM